MGIADTSRESYKKLTDLGDKQQQLFEALQQIEPASDRDLEKKLGWMSIAHVTPRRRELVEYGFIVQRGRKYDRETQRSVKAWVTTDPMALRQIEKTTGKLPKQTPAEEPEEPKPQPLPEEAVREVLLVLEAGEWVESNQIPATLRRRQQQYRMQKIGVDTGHIYYDMLTYFEDGYDANRSML